jgi:integrase
MIPKYPKMSPTAAAAPTRRRALLTDTAVKNLKPRAKALKVPDAGGLFLQVQPSGSKLWRYRFWLHEKEGVLALGKYPDVSLSDARERCAAARKLVAQGTNPVHAQQRAKHEAAREQQQIAEGTFEAVCESWRSISDKKLRPASIAQREREIAKDLMPTLRNRPIGQITRLELTTLLHKIEHRAPETARNLRMYLFAIFERAIDTGLLESNPCPPARLLAPRSKEGHAAVPVDRIGQFLRALDTHEAVALATRIAMLLIILCVSRRAEVTGARWAEFDLDGALWSIPAGRMKGKKDHLVPLSRQAVALLRELRALVPAEREFLFPNRRDTSRPMVGPTLHRAMGAMGYVGVGTIHGWRAVFSTRYNELERNAGVIETCLAHVHGTNTQRAYNRAAYLDQRRELLQEWADYLDAEREKKTEADTGLVAA